MNKFKETLKSGAQVCRISLVFNLKWDKDSIFQNPCTIQGHGFSSFAQGRVSTLKRWAGPLPQFRAGLSPCELWRGWGQNSGLRNLNLARPVLDGQTKLSHNSESGGMHHYYLHIRQNLVDACLLLLHMWFLIFKCQYSHPHSITASLVKLDLSSSRQSKECPIWKIRRPCTSKCLETKVLTIHGAWLLSLTRWLAYWERRLHIEGFKKPSKMKW